jgi:glutamate carboxypeptidase
MMPARQALFDALSRSIAAREQEMIAFLTQIVNMDSPSEDKALTDRVGDVLQRKAESLGMACEIDPQSAFGDNRICRIAPAAAAAAKRMARVLLVGHFDTVYAAGTVAQRPFRIEGDTAYGPGTNDMKGGLAVGLFALQALRDVLGDMPVEVTFIFNSDEEVGSPRSRKVILAEGARHDVALVLEPGADGPALKIRRRGVGIFRIHVEGIEAHAGTEPEKGANSIVEMAHKVLAVEALNDAAAGTTVTAGVIHGGTKPYVVPGACVLEIDSRVTSLREQARIEAALAAIAGRTIVPGTRSRLEGSFHRPPMETSERTMAYIAHMQQVGEAVGFPIATAASGASSDGNLLAAAGTPTIDGLGPHGGRPHSPNEYIELATLGAKCKLLAAFLATLDPIDR